MGAFLEGGRAWATALESIRGFPRSIIAFVQLGEDQGELGLALLEVSRSESGRFLERERWAEVLMGGTMVFLGALVGLEAVAMYLPIFSMGTIL
jgi:type IV pilus assembly protein PilC